MHQKINAASVARLFQNKADVSAKGYAHKIKQIFPLKVMLVLC